jgi:HSP20 family protein
MAESHETDNPGPTQNNMQPAQRTRTDTLTSGRLPSVSRPEQAAPSSFMRRFMSEMDSLFEDFGFGTPFASSLGRTQPTGGDANLWLPQIDVSTRDGQLQVHADLPGMRQEDVNVSVHDGVLSISGERANQHEQNRSGVYRRERSYGSFRRDVPLPAGVDADSIKASFENGVLEVTMPLPKESKPAGCTIPISPKQSGGPDVH